MPGSRLYRALLHCYPAAFRQEYGREMAAAFAEQLAEARQAGVRRRAAVWLEAAADALTIAPKEHAHVIYQDLRYALRVLAAKPGFAAVAILSLALGIGANTAIFSLWNGLLHDSLAGVANPGQLVMLTDPDESGAWTGRSTFREDGPRSWLTYSEFEQLRQHTEIFSAMMASQSSLDSFQVRFDNGDWEKADGRLVSGNYFDVLGVQPLLGRVFTEAADRENAAQTVIGYGYWQRRFGGRPDVLGKTIALRKTMLTVVGVTPPGFAGETQGQQPDLWIPMHMQPRVIPGRDWLHDQPPEKRMWLHVFARLQPGVPMARAEAQTNAIFQAGLETFYGSLTGDQRREALDQRIRIRPAPGGASPIRPALSTSLTALLAGVGVLLLIACANLANLMLARGAARKAEMALRLSLGASRGRLIRQLVTESLALAVLGGAGGLAAAWFLHRLLVGMMTSSVPDFRMDFTLDPMVAAFAVAATLGATLLFGVLPAWQLTSLQELGRGTGSLGRLRGSRWLVSLQLALSLPLLVGAGLLARTLYNLERLDLGYPAQKLLVVRVDALEAGYDGTRRDHLVLDLLAKFRRLPGVSAASYSELGVFSGGDSSNSIEVEGFTSREDRDRHSMDTVGPDYFAALGVPMMLGRDIQDSDGPGAPNVCVINEAFAKRYFHGRNPLGLRITVRYDGARTPFHVVGVARDARTAKLRDAVEPRMFLAGQQQTDALKSPFFLVRTASAVAPVMAAVREAIQRTDAALNVESAKTIEEWLSPQTAQERTTAQLATVFGSVALLLAAIGLYGVLSYGVARRTGEVAVRIAVGARPGRVIAMILGETSGVVLAGLAIGVALAYAASSLLRSRLYGVAPGDPLTLAVASAVLVLTALAAAYLPARRASRLDPMTALRQE